MVRVDGMVEKNFGEIIYQKEKGVALLKIGRPRKLNSLDADGLSNLRQALTAADSNKDVRVIVITGSGNRAFSTGFDIFGVPDLSVAESRLLHINNQKLYCNLMGLGKVTIAAVNDVALGTGFEISLLCDLTVAAESATFSMSEMAFGAYPGQVAVTLLWQFIGMKRSWELLLTGKKLNAFEAASLGLVNEVVADNELMDRAMDLATTV